MMKLDFIALALHGKKAGLEKVAAMIDKMMATLAGEQKEDDDKKDYCNAELDKADDEKKALTRKVADAQTAIEDAQKVSLQSQRRSRPSRPGSQNWTGPLRSPPRSGRRKMQPTNSSWLRMAPLRN